MLLSVIFLFLYSCKTTISTDLKSFIREYPFNNQGMVIFVTNKKNYQFFVNSSFDKNWILTSTLMNLSFTLKISSDIEVEGTSDPYILNLIKTYEPSLKVFFSEIQHLKTYGQFCSQEEENLHQIICKGIWQKNYPFIFQYNQEKIIFHKNKILFSSLRTSNTIELVF